jgi:uncharacterized protein (TIGR02117 family)
MPRREEGRRTAAMSSFTVDPTTQRMAVGPPVTLFVIKRSWHTDIGFAVADLRPPLMSLHVALPNARYLLFGFGDKRYLVSHAGSVGRLSGAVWPGEGLVLLTGLEGPPEVAFGANEVARLNVSPSQAQALQDFVWRTFATDNGTAKLLAPGPYEGSLYYASTVRYSGLHTCNTWTAESLRAAGLPVHTFGVEFSGQVWRQVRKISAGSPRRLWPVPQR